MNHGPVEAGDPIADTHPAEADEAEESGRSPRSPIGVMRRWLGVGVMAVAAVAIGMAALRGSDPAPYRPQGKPLPLPEGGRLAAVSRAEFDGVLVGQAPKPVIVNVWASWCAPCRTEMPLLSKAAKAYAGEVTIVGVATRDDPDAAQRFLDDLEISYPNVFDADGSVRAALGATVFPTTYVFGSDGELRSKVSGGISEQRLAALIEDSQR